MPINAVPDPPRPIPATRPAGRPGIIPWIPRCDPWPAGRARRETPRPLQELRLPHGGALWIAGCGGPRRHRGRPPPCHADVWPKVSRSSQPPLRDTPGGQGMVGLRDQATYPLALLASQRRIRWAAPQWSRPGTCPPR